MAFHVFMFHTVREAKPRLSTYLEPALRRQYKYHNINKRWKTERTNRKAK